MARVVHPAVTAGQRVTQAVQQSPHILASMLHQIFVSPLTRGPKFGEDGDDRRDQAAAGKKHVGYQGLKGWVHDSQVGVRPTTLDDLLAPKRYNCGRPF